MAGVNNVMVILDLAQTVVAQRPGSVVTGTWSMPVLSTASWMTPMKELGEALVFGDSCGQLTAAQFWQLPCGGQALGVMTHIASAAQSVLASL